MAVATQTLTPTLTPTLTATKHVCLVTPNRSGTQTLTYVATPSAIVRAFVCAGVILIGSIVTVDSRGDESKIAVHTVIDGLDNPCGVAVQPGTGHVVVSESGAGRILRVAVDVAKPMVTGFPKDVYGDGTYEEGTRFDIGPLGLAFLDRNTLIVGGGGLPDGQDLVRFYAMPVDGKTILAENMKFKISPIVAGEGNFFGLAVGTDAVFVACNGDDTKGSIARLGISNGKPDGLSPFISAKLATGVASPTCIAISGEGYLVVGQMGETTVRGDSLLTFYDAKSKAVLSTFAAGLNDVVAIAYSPKRGLLYALDFAWGENSEDGGLYRLDSGIADGKQAVNAVKVLAIQKPTAMAFAPDGVLYVTAMGNPGSDAKKKSGKLLRLTGHL